MDEEKEFERVNVPVAELDKARYQEMLRFYYAADAGLDRAIFNWSTLALAGLLALGLKEGVIVGWGLKILWSLAVVSFIVAGAAKFLGVQEAVRQHFEETNDFNRVLPKSQGEEENDKAISRYKGLAKWAFFSGVGLSAFLVGVLVYF